MEVTVVYFSHIFSETHQPHFPSIVENVTVSYGRKAVLKCEVENLRNYKVMSLFGLYRDKLLSSFL